MSARSAAPSERVTQLDVSILGREYRIACRESERAELLEAVSLLDQRMREIRDAGKVTGVDRIAVMAALNLSHDLLKTRRAPASAPASSPPASPSSPSSAAPIDDPASQRRIKTMLSAIDQVMSQEKLL